jgi:hypothetical protein
MELLATTVILKLFVTCICKVSGEYKGGTSNMEWIYFLNVNTLKTEDKIRSALPHERRQ